MEWIADPTLWVGLLTLVVLEIVLGIDNLIFIAILADKLPPASAIPTDITLSLPKGTRVIQSAVVSDRLVMTLEIDGKVEVRTFDVTTLQPAGRLNFSAAP